MTDDDALAFARIIDEANENRVTLVGLMKAIARYGRPSSLPDDVRDAWDNGERVVGEATVSELLAITSQAMHERGRQQIVKSARRRGRAA